ncbi:hypothetical protein FM038_013395 [Shewanella eurypsychrophilus]|uniref:Uncharacterized protein n=1 Tax=Shewanella eurypsychrophilus TaxID=2593656 RepID=A0ABX6V6S5_9GAMM|nr:MULTISPECIES: hypothetical protein [Shewanella]QFU23046.1 hypothetical protein FS418_14975 [Shewanella sp. YLB-09]QPG58329.1 hypothetical protein FM038_013395 [Shewanella eurypsychrophilus]
MLEFIGYLLIAIVCIPVIFIVVNMTMAAIWIPIGKAIDFLFHFPIGRLILAPIIFVSAAMAGMRLFASPTFGVIIGIVGVYILLWEKDD